MVIELQQHELSAKIHRCVVELNAVVKDAEKLGMNVELKVDNTSEPGYWRPQNLLLVECSAMRILRPNL